MKGTGKSVSVLCVIIWLSAGFTLLNGQKNTMLNGQKNTHMLDRESGVYQVTDFGASGDGQTINTPFIQKAIDSCAESGGGRVAIGPGIFLTGTLVLKDNVELHVREGATLLGSTDILDYPELVTGYRFYGDEWVKQSLIFGANLNNISITGKGVIDGQGEAFEVATKIKPDRYRNRPYLIRFTQCTHVTLKEITLQNSAMWMQHYLACEGVLIDGIKVFNHCNKNNDMIDIDGCRDVLITRCVGDTDDDAVTLKSTSPRLCENITISDCVLSSHCNAIKLGTESTGGFKNITITDCLVKPSGKEEVIYGLPGGISGISLEVVDGGAMDGIYISNVLIEGPEVPIFVRLGNRGRPYIEGMEKPSTGSVQNITIQNIIATNVGITGCSVTGIEDYPVRNVSLQNIIMELPGGISGNGDAIRVPELEDSYPESTMFGMLPASVLYMRHVEQISLSKFVVSFHEPDNRYHLAADDVVGLVHSEIVINESEEIRVLMNNR